MVQKNGLKGWVAISRSSSLLSVSFSSQMVGISVTISVSNIYSAFKLLLLLIFMLYLTFYLIQNIK
jgi:hypothetical protein